MRLVEVVASDGAHRFIIYCWGCGKRLSSATDIVFADLDGTPFVDYYCADCAKEMDNAE